MSGTVLTLQSASSHSGSGYLDYALFNGKGYGVWLGDVEGSPSFAKGVLSCSIVGSHIVNRFLAQGYYNCGTGIRLDVHAEDTYIAGCYLLWNKLNLDVRGPRTTVIGNYLAYHGGDVGLVYVDPALDSTVLIGNSTVAPGESGKTMYPAQIYNSTLTITNPDGNNGIILETTASTDAPFLTFKGNGSSAADKYSMRYHQSLRRFSLGYGDVAGFTPQMVIRQDTGNVSIGITDPQHRLHVASAYASVCVLRADTYCSNALAPAVLQLRRSRSDSVGSMAETQDGNSLAAIETFGVKSGGGSFAKAAAIEVVQDGSAGSSYNPAKIDLKTSPGGSTPPASRICIRADGKVGVGTTGPTAKLDVSPGTISDSNPNLRLRGTTSTVPSAGNDGDIQVYESGSTRRLYIKVNGTWRYATLT